MMMRNKTTYKVKKIASDYDSIEYEYRGACIIMRRDIPSGYTGKATIKGDMLPTRRGAEAATLKQAKEIVNYWIDRK